MAEEYPKKTWRRRQYVIDRETQFAVVLQALLGIGAALVLYLCGRMLFMGENAMDMLQREDVRPYLLAANAIYFVVVTAVLVGVLLHATHKFAGPAYVMKKALEGILQGDYDRRLSLRQGDFQKDLARTLSQVRDHWRRREESWTETVARLEACLADGDLEQARALLESLHEQAQARPAREPAASAASAAS